MVKSESLKSPRLKTGKSRTKPPKLKCFSRPSIEWMRRIHQKLQANHFPNYRKLVEMLEVSPKTIQRDIEFMRDQQSSRGYC